MAHERIVCGCFAYLWGMAVLWEVWLGVEEKGELRRRVSNRYVAPVWSSSFGTIKRLDRFAKLTIVEMCWLSNMSLTER